MSARPLKGIIKGAGLRLGYVAERAGITPFRLSRLLNGRESARIDEVKQLARVLRLSQKCVREALE